MSTLGNGIITARVWLRKTWHDRNGRDSRVPVKRQECRFPEGRAARVVPVGKCGRAAARPSRREGCRWRKGWRFPPASLKSQVSCPPPKKTRRCRAAAARHGPSAQNRDSLIFSKTSKMRLSQLTSHQARVILPLSPNMRGNAHANTKTETAILWS